MRQLIAEAAAGNPAARIALVNSIKQGIRKRAVSLAARTGQDADDVEQEGWTGLFEALPRVDVTIGQPEVFLLRKARWRMLDYIRRRIREPLAYPAEPLETGSQLPELDHIAELFNRQPPLRREILRLLMADLTWRDVGRLLGMTSANVAYHVRKLREYYVRTYGTSNAA